MYDRFFLITFILLFSLSVFGLTLQQNFLWQSGNAELVTAQFRDLNNPDDFSFIVSHRSNNPRDVTLIHELRDREKEETSITLMPTETRVFSPAKKPERIIIRYQNTLDQTEELLLYKK